MNEHQIQSFNIQSEQIKSSWLQTNPNRKVSVYLPPDYSESKRYPQIYFLAGWSSDGDLLLSQQNVFSKSLPDLFTQSILKMAMEPFVGVFPNCETPLGGSQYIDSPATGKFMTYLCDELVPVIESRYSVETSAHGVMGHSSGGFGALALGMMRPDVFSHICASAADSWYEYLYLHIIPAAIESLKRHRGAAHLIEKFLTHPNPMGLLSRKDGETMMLLNICACFLPNAEKAPVFGDLFFDEQTGRLIDSLWKKLLDWDPIHMIDRYEANLKRLKWIHLQAGLDDEYALHLGHRQISQKLNDKNILHLIEEYPGRHSGHSYRYVDRVSKMISQM